MIEAQASEYFQGACDRILVPATEVQETIWLVFSMEILAISSMSEVGSEQKFSFGTSLRLTKGFLSNEKLAKGSVTTDHHPPPPPKTQICGYPEIERIRIFSY